MPGIVAVVEWDRHGAARGAAETMLRALAHRGSDDQGLYLAPPARTEACPAVVVGHTRRTGSPDSPEHEPLPGADGLVWAAADAELTDTAELRDDLRRLGFRFRTDSPTEVLLNGYLAWGAEFLHRLDGGFAFVIFDARDRTLLAGRDRFGIRPLYWWADRSRLLLASEIPALLTQPSVPRRLNAEAAYRFLVPDLADDGAETFFADIRRLRAGHVLKLPTLGPDCAAGPRPEVREIARPVPQTRIAELPPDRRAARFGETLAAAVARRCDAGRIVVPWTGSLDALAVAGAAVKAGSSVSLLVEPDLPAPPAGMARIEVPPSPPASLDDLRSLVRNLGEPFADPGVFGLRRRLAAADDATILGCDGSLELLGGHPRARAFACAEFLRRFRFLPLARELRSWMADDARSLRRLPFALLPRAWRSSLIESRRRHGWLAYEFLQSHRGSAAAETAGRLDDVAADQCLWWLNSASLPPVLRGVDRLVASAGARRRLPLLDVRVVDSALGLPPEDRIEFGRPFAVLRRLSVAPEACDTDPAPLRLALARRELAHWQDVLDDLFASPAVERLGLFEPRALRRRWSEIRDGAPARHNEPWKWASLILWREAFDVTI